MNKTLDFSHEEFQDILQKTSDLILKQYQNMGSLKGYNAPEQPEIEAWFDEPLPLSGMDIEPLLKKCNKKSLTQQRLCKSFCKAFAVSMSTMR